MKRVLWAIIGVVLLLGTVAPVSAQRDEWRGGIRSRIREARGRIERGIERGSLTRQEARGLNEELDGILRKIDRMRDDGYLSPREREIIERDLDRLHRHITQEKRDDDYRRRR